MVAVSPILVLLHLLAAAPRGRQRFAPRNKQKKRRTAPNDAKRNQQQKPEELPVPPLPTLPNGPFPTYFTCRHTYEGTLMEELRRLKDANIQAHSPCPGLVRVEASEHNQHTAAATALLDPAYALQIMPDCRIVEIPNSSIKNMATCLSDMKHIQNVLQDAPKGSLVIHALVPGMCKGQREPVQLQRRANLVADALVEILQKRYPAARKKKTGETASQPLLLLQLMLFSTNVVAVSLSTCCSKIDNTDNMLWPNPYFPAGLAKVDIVDTKMPSSAYRKLLEAFSCWQTMPFQDDRVVDLGASPGGWTKAVLLYAKPQKIIAVDRAQLDPELMALPEMDFVQGDAFTYVPKTAVDWMMSDIIAYPERIVDELLTRWCGEHLARNMVVTLKFQGESPSWDALQNAINVSKIYGYQIRVKHFFNNKNEVTLMLERKDDNMVDDVEQQDQQQQYEQSNTSDDDETLRQPLYKLTWPKTN